MRALKSIQPNPNMLAPEDIRRWASAKFPSFIDAAIRGESMFPLDLKRFGRADRSAGIAELDRQVRALVDGSVEVFSSDFPAIQKARTGLGYSVEMKLHRLRQHKEQPLPVRVWFETELDFLHFIGKRECWCQLQEDIRAIGNAGSTFQDWANGHPRVLLSRLRPGSGPALALALRELQRHPLPGCFAREIPLSGVSGKFIEENLALIADILREVGSPAWTPASSLHEQLGLRQTSRLLRLMILDGRRLDYGLPLERFTGLPPDTRQVLIVENLRTFLTLPPIADTLAVFGEGRAAQTLAGIEWLTSVPLIYWGDIDPNGMGILNSLRREYPALKSALMDADTLSANRTLLSPAHRLKNPDFSNLQPHELEAANYVQTRAQGVEQEKLPQSYVWSALKAAMVGHQEELSTDRR